MDENIITQAIDYYFDKCYYHTKQAINNNQGEYTSNNPFSILMGKMVECIYSYHPRSSKPNFDLNGKDGGVDLIIDNKNVSIKMRVLQYPKPMYFNSENYVFGKQFDEAYKIIKQLVSYSKCDYLLGVIRYQSPDYYFWQKFWKQEDVKSLKLASQSIFENDCLWFSTKSGNVIFDC